ncbi:MAG: hypothetical protein WBA74_23990 [Cyclobacteriaceae bacterium]
MSYTDDTINAYLAGELTGEEKEKFLHDLDSDKELQERVAFYKELDQFLMEDDWPVNQPDTNRARDYADYLKGTEGQQLRQSVGSASDTYFSQEDKPKGKQVFGFFGKLSVAAGFLIIVAGAAFYMLNNPSATDLYMAYKDTGRLPSLINRNTVAEYGGFTELYTQGKNKEALSWLEGYLSNKQGAVNPQLYLYKGALHMRLNQDERAIKTYRMLLDSETVDATKGHWYLALIYLKNNNREAAQNELSLLLDSDSGFNSEEAREILDKLD